MVAPKAPRNPATLAVELAGHAYVWGRAVALQAERVVDDATPFRFAVADRQVDCYLLVIAIHQVLRSADAMDKAIGGDAELRAAQARFLAEHQQAKTMRDVLSHFDEYEAGTGKLQRSGKLGPLLIWWGVGEDSVTLALAENLTVELSTASSAAVALAEATLLAKDRFLTRFRESRTPLGTESLEADGRAD